MWEAIKNALVSVKESTGIEIPELPADLGSIADSATTAGQTLTESASGAVDGANTAAEAVAGGVAGVTETAATASDSVPPTLADLPGGLPDGRPEK